MYQAVLGGQTVACFEDTPVMTASIKDGDLALKILEDTANEGQPYGFAIFNEEKSGTARYVQRRLANIKENGTYDEIINRYLGES